jgi:hypothetical protein
MKRREHVEGQVFMNEPNGKRKNFKQMMPRLGAKYRLRSKRHPSPSQIIKRMNTLNWTCLLAPAVMVGDEIVVEAPTFLKKSRGSHPPALRAGRT